MVYGQFLKEFVNDVKILYYKDPPFIRKVKYSDIVDNLYNTKISDNEHEDKYVKKIIANVNIGLLEKGVNKAEKSTILIRWKQLSIIKHNMEEVLEF